MSIYQDILDAVKMDQKLLAVLIDPDKMRIEEISSFMLKLNSSLTSHIFIGGSTVEDGLTEKLAAEIKKHTDLPLVLFPGDITQITNHADALLFLSLISGRNAEYLIGKQVKAVPLIKLTSLEVIPTGYMLIENGKETTVQRVSETQPLPIENHQKISDTAKAGELLGMKLIYLEAGSGATHPVPLDIITKAKNELSVPLIVGGGIKSKKQLEEAYNAGADLVVIGTAIEDDESFFNALR